MTEDRGRAKKRVRDLQEEVASNFDPPEKKFQSPTGGGDITSELRVHWKKQPVVHQIQEKMVGVVIDKVRNVGWPFWKDCILLKELRAAQQQKQNQYYDVWSNEIHYGWKLLLLWDVIKENLDTRVHMHELSLHVCLEANIKDTTLEQLKERVRLLKKHATKICHANADSNDDRVRTFCDNVMSLFFKGQGPLGVVEVPRNASNRAAASSSRSIVTHSQSIVTHSNPDSTRTIASTSVSRLLFKPDSSGAKDYIDMSTRVARRIEKFYADGFISLDDRWMATMRISESNFGVGMFLGFSEEEQIKFIKTLIQPRH